MSELTDTPSSAYIRGELVKMLHQHTWLMSLAVGLTATGFTAYLFADALPLTWVVAWFVLINSIILVRIGLILGFARAVPAAEALPKWERYQTAAVWLNGLAWGLPAFALSNGDLTLIFFYATVLCGFVAGAIPALTYSVPAYSGFAVLAGAPLIGRLFTLDEVVFHLIGVLACLFVLINIASVRLGNRRVREQISLEFANRQLVRDLTVAKEQAERADAVKSQFLAAASHDLRQPLHALGLFVDALDQQTHETKLRNLIGNIKLSTTSLGELLDALLDVSRLDAGVVQPERSAFPVQTLLTTLAAELQADADEKGLALRVAPCSAWVYSDSGMVSRILLNVLVNALRYTEHGRVLMGCRRVAGGIRLEVHDTGPGMTPEQLARVFDEFYQVGNPQRDRRLGVGLGLAIVRRLSDMLGHEMSLQSRVGRGTVFRLQLPAGAPPPVSEQAPLSPERSLEGVRLLVIDNEAPAREALIASASLWGVQAMGAEDGDSAMRLLESQPCAPDLLIVDYRLGGEENGAGVIGRIRARYGREVPAVIVTGDTAPERLREAQASGCQLLHKPVPAAKLRSMVAHLVMPKPREP
jgi:two-component system, sensor histidine kinase